MKACEPHLLEINPAYILCYQSILFEINKSLEQMKKLVWMDQGIVLQVNYDVHYFYFIRLYRMSADVFIYLPTNSSE